MLLPAKTGTGLAEFVKERSAESATSTLTDALLLPGFGSPVTPLPTVTVSVMVVPEATALFTCTTKVKLAVPAAAKLAIVHLYGTTEVQTHPAGPESDTKAVPAGTVSARVTVLAGW